MFWNKKKKNKKKFLKNNIIINKIAHPLYHPKGETAFRKSVLQIRDIMLPFLLEEMSRENGRKVPTSLLKEGSNLLSFLSTDPISILKSKQYLRDYVLLNTPRENNLLPNRINNLFLTIGSIIDPSSIMVLKGRFSKQLINYHKIELDAINTVDITFPYFFMHNLLYNTYITLSLKHQ